VGLSAREQAQAGRLTGIKTMSSEIDKIHCGCHICGTGKPRYYNAHGIFGLPACYDCYVNRPVNELEIESNLSKMADKKFPGFNYQWCIEFNELKAEFLKRHREDNGVFDPVFKCRYCGVVQSIFNFRVVHEKCKCRSCEIIHQSTRKCPRCKNIVENELFPEGDQYCLQCRNELKKQAVDRLEKYLSYVSEKQCVAALKYRGIDPTSDAISLIRQLILSKRIKKTIKYNGGEYESNYADVYGKQRSDEENYEGRVQA
jgi:hypothetical protein